MYTRFVFGKASRDQRKNQESHEYGVFMDPLSLKDGDLNELRWKSKLKVDQARLVSKAQDSSVDMVSIFILYRILTRRKKIGIIFPMIIQTRNNASKDKLNLRSEVKNPIAEIFDNSRGYPGIKPS